MQLLLNNALALAVNNAGSITTAAIDKIGRSLFQTLTGQPLVLAPSDVLNPLILDYVKSGSLKVIDYLSEMQREAANFVPARRGRGGKESNSENLIDKMEANAEFGFDSIGAVATQKMQTTDLNIGMPSAYQSVYAAAKIRPRYFPEMRAPSEGTFWVAPADDPNFIRHDSNMQMAHHMVRAAVQSKASSTNRLDKTAHAMGYQPAPVLGQRRFANPSNGSYPSGNSARMDQNGPWKISESLDTFHGGVLRTKVGQEYAHARLKSRVSELNAIDSAKKVFKGDVAVAEENTETFNKDKAGLNSLIELNLYLQHISDAVEGGQLDNFDIENPEDLDATEIQDIIDKRKTSAAEKAVPNPKDVSRALALIFRLAPIMDKTALDHTFMQIERINSGVDNLLNPDEAEIEPKYRETLLTIQVLFEKLESYLKQMIGNVDLSIKAKKDLSKNLVKSLGFSTNLRNYRPDNPYNELLPADVRKRIRERYHHDPVIRFDRPAVPREDTRAYIDPRARYDYEPRDAFGYDAGAYYDSGGRGYEQWNYRDEEEDDVDDGGVSAWGYDGYDLNDDNIFDGLGKHAKKQASAPAPHPKSKGKFQTRAFFDPDTQGFNVGNI